MPTSGDVVEIDLGVPMGSEAGMIRPAVVVTADPVLAAGPTVFQVVPLTRTRRRHRTEVLIEADDANGLTFDSAAQCQHIRAVASSRVQETLGNIGPVALAQIRHVLAALLDTAP